jgi:hypothetical protein
MFHQCSPLGNKQARLPINGVTNLEFDIVKNTINGKDTLSLMQFNNPLKLKILATIIKKFELMRWRTRQQIKI